MPDTVSYEELLENDGTVITHVTGSSMEPLLHDRQSIVVVESAGKVQPRKNDVVLFRKNGSYILHRILTKNGKNLIICGDNSKVMDYVNQDEILGVMTAYYRIPEGKKHIRGSLFDQVYCLVLSLIRCTVPYWIRINKRIFFRNRNILEGEQNEVSEGNSGSNSF